MTIVLLSGCWRCVVSVGTGVAVVACWSFDAGNTLNWSCGAAAVTCTVVAFDRCTAVAVALGCCGAFEVCMSVCCSCSGGALVDCCCQGQSCSGRSRSSTVHLT